METLLSILTKLTNLPEQELIPVLDLFESIDVPANKTLLTAGSICSKVWVVECGGCGSCQRRPRSVCSKVWFVGCGSLRAHYYQEERKRTKSGNNGEKAIREVTDWLVAPNGLYTLVDGSKEAGTHTKHFNTANLPAGLYFYRLETDNASFTKRMVVVR